MREAQFRAAPPEHDPPLLLAALGPKMLMLSRDLADGAHPYLVTPSTPPEPARSWAKAPCSPWSKRWPRRTTVMMP